MYIPKKLKTYFVPGGHKERRILCILGLRRPDNPLDSVLFPDRWRENIEGRAHG